MGYRDGHVHRYGTRVALVHGHIHWMEGLTGPPVHLPDGRHYHEMSGRTSCDDGHRHGYRNPTGLAALGVPHTHTFAGLTAVNDRHAHPYRGVTGGAIG